MKSYRFIFGVMSTSHLNIISIFIFGVIFLNSVLIQNGISRTAIREENDYYATDPKAIDYLLRYDYLLLGYKFILINMIILLG